MLIVYKVIEVSSELNVLLGGPWSKVVGHFPDLEDGILGPSCTLYLLFPGYYGLSNSPVLGTSTMLLLSLKL